MDYLKQLLIGFNLRRVLHLQMPFNWVQTRSCGMIMIPLCLWIIANRAIATTSSNALSLGSSSGQLTLGNLTNAANATGDYKTPTLSFDLSKVPTGSGSGTISLDLINGTDAARDAGERHIHLDLSVNWSGDGSSASITMPVQTVSGYYLTTSGSRIDFYDR